MMENWMPSFSLVKIKEVEQQQETLDTETGNKFKIYIEWDVQNITMATYVIQVYSLNTRLIKITNNSSLVFWGPYMSS